MENKIIALFAVAIFAFAFTVTAYADESIDNSTILTETELNAINQTFSNPGILPDDFWYGFKRFGEDLNKFFTFNKTEKAKLNLELAKLRLAEAKAMAEKNRLEYVKSLIQDYNNELNDADQNTPLGLNISEVIRQANMTLPKGEIILEMLYAKASDSEKHDIEIAINNSIEKMAILQEKIHAKINETMEEFRNRTINETEKRIHENLEKHKMKIAKIGEKHTEMLESSLHRLDELIGDAQEKNQTSRIQAFQGIQQKLEDKIQTISNRTDLRIEKITELENKIEKRLRGHGNEHD